MTPFKALLVGIGWSHQQAADRLGRARGTIDGWCIGRNARGNPAEAPASCVEGLERIAAVIEREQAAWKRGGNVT